MNIGAVHSLDNTSFAKTLPVRGVNKFKNLSYAECEHFWSYAGKLNLLLRNFLNASARSPMIVFFAGNAFPCTVKSLVTRMKLLSMISVPFSLVDVTSIFKKINNSLLINDKEGVGLSSLSLMMTISDAVDSFSTFINSLLIVTKGNPIQIFSLLGLPLGFIIAGTGTVSRTIYIAKALNLYRNIQPEHFFKIGYIDKSVLKKELEAMIGIDNVSNEQKKAIVSRLIPKDAMPAFEQLVSMLEANDGSVFSEQELDEVFKCLANIRKDLEKKMKIDIAGIFANLLVISALVLFSIGVSNAHPFLLMGTAFTIRLISLAYQDQKIQFTDK